MLLMSVMPKADLPTSPIARLRRVAMIQLPGKTTLRAALHWHQFPPDHLGNSLTHLVGGIGPARA